jgi:mono/diheme cytochrome c family protein
MYILKTKRVIAWSVGAAVLVTAGWAGYRILQPHGEEPQPPVAGVPADFQGDQLARGEYITRAADCVACHTTRGGTPFAGGRAFALPFGTVYATNLTPDPETGLGKWSDDAFVDAVRQGKGSNGHLYPAMPYTSYAAMSRDDVLAIKAYLDSLEPVHQPTPSNTLSFPFNQRWGMTFWDIAFFNGQRFKPTPDWSPAENRGAYLATALGHCGECHTPRNVGFAMKSQAYLSGAEIEGWKAYNTTGDAAYGIGGWSDEQLTGYLSRGHAPGRSSAAGPMAEVIEHSLQHLTPDDIQSLVRYMRRIAPDQGDVAQGVSVTLESPAIKASSAVLPGASSASDNQRGQRLFDGDCAGCHQWNGVGRQTPYASLAGSRAVNDPSGHALIQVVLNGTTLEVQGRKQLMPGFGSTYSDADIAAVTNYVLAHFGDKQGQVTADTVQHARAAVSSVGTQ